MLSLDLQRYVLLNPIWQQKFHPFVSERYHPKQIQQRALWFYTQDVPKR